MALNRKNVRDLLLSFPITRELSFFIHQKKVYKWVIDKKIATLLQGKKKLSKKKIDNLIVSLTSFPQRIDEIKYTVYSLLDQTVLPEKIILWLAESQFPNKEEDLPEELLAFKKFGFDIKWCEDIRSYKKLVPTLEHFPNNYIVTADDDLYYKRKWLEKLWFEHLKYPDDIVCHLAAEIFVNDKEVLPYMQWKKYIPKETEGFQVFPCGAGGILYHQRYLHKDINRNDLFLKLAPHADDIWFYFMAVLGGTKIRVIKKPYVNVKYLNPYREYGLDNKLKLSTINVDGGLNDEQFKNIIEYYNVDLHSLVYNCGGLQ